MIDFLEQEIKLDDMVISMVPDYRCLLVGRVINFTPHKIRIKCGKQESLKYPHQVVVINKLLENK